MKMNKKMKIEDLKIQSFVTSMSKEAKVTVNGGQKSITYCAGGGCPTNYCAPTLFC